jgi:hypothetical protein
VKGFALLLALFCSTAAADNLARPPKPYELQGVKLCWGQIPYPSGGFEYETGWELVNPEGFACEPIYGACDWFECRIRVDDLTQKLTITGAVECASP